MFTPETKSQKDKLHIKQTILVVLLVGTIAISGYVYLIYQQSVSQFSAEEGSLAKELDFYKTGYNRLTKFILSKIYNIPDPDKPKLGIILVGTTDFQAPEGFSTKMIMFKNVGNTIMTDFKVSLNEKKITPYYASKAVFPDESGIIILWLSQYEEWKSTKADLIIESEKISVKTALS
ncbi:MAG: hypothetical protein HY361_03500 [Candidatus Aenigmarchaeota archaeon]|nr:hypothetical protein [Candidatus Aenigmarchaeota archaeon]